MIQDGLLFYRHFKMENKPQNQMNPWKKLDSQMIYENPWIHLT